LLVLRGCQVPSAGGEFKQVMPQVVIVVSVVIRLEDELGMEEQLGLEHVGIAHFAHLSLLLED